MYEWRFVDKHKNESEMDDTKSLIAKAFKNYDEVCKHFETQER